MEPTIFQVTENHLKLLERTYVGWRDYAYDGAPGVDPKRPFGDSDVLRDIYEITHDGETPEGVDPEDFYEEDHPELQAIFREMEYVVQIALNLAGKGQLIKPGIYFRPDRYCSRIWEREA